MGFQPENGYTTIRIVFEQYAGAFRAHTIDYSCKNAADREGMEKSTLLNIRRSVLRDFQDCVMDSLAWAGISGACVTFDKFENSEYAQAAQEMEPVAA